VQAGRQARSRPSFNFQADGAKPASMRKRFPQSGQPAELRWCRARLEKPSEINPQAPAARRRLVRISAMQQQARQIGRFSFHIMETVFNIMIICNIYHSAVRKIRL
jgi:hypothetical protein